MNEAKNFDFSNFNQELNLSKINWTDIDYNPKINFEKNNIQESTKLELWNFFQELVSYNIDNTADLINLNLDNFKSLVYSKLDIKI